jgi:hypothetical protein
MKDEPPQRLFLVPPSVIAPLVLSGVAISLGVAFDEWVLGAIPFVLLGSFCSAPNLNLADGCLVVLAVLVGCAIAASVSLHFGAVMIIGTVAGWIFGAVEKNLRMKRVVDSVRGDTTEGQ